MRIIYERWGISKRGFARAHRAVADQGVKIQQRDLNRVKRGTWVASS